MNQNQYAIITGASAGLGKEFAKLFAQDNINVVLVARRKDRLEALAKELKQANPKIKVEIRDTDLSKPKACKQLVESLAGNDIAYLVNNAGFGTAGDFHELPTDRELEMIDLNIRALVELTSLVLPQMVDRGHGKILNVGSVAGFQPGPFMATYFATKAFVNSFSEAIAEELKGTGVSVTVLTPGPVETEFIKVAEVEESYLFKMNLSTAKDVALTGYKAMMKGEVLSLHGIKFKTMLQTYRLMPRALLRKATGALNKMK